MSQVGFVIVDVDNTPVWSSFQPTALGAITAFTSIPEWEAKQLLGYRVLPLNAGDAFKAPSLTVDWELYKELAGADEASKHLTTTLATLLGESRARGYPLADIREIENAMHKAMNEYSRFGATDGDSRRALTRVLEKAFRTEL